MLLVAAAAAPAASGSSCCCRSAVSQASSCCLPGQSDEMYLQAADRELSVATATSQHIRCPGRISMGAVSKPQEHMHAGLSRVAALKPALLVAASGGALPPGLQLLAGVPAAAAALSARRPSASCVPVLPPRQRRRRHATSRGSTVQYQQYLTSSVAPSAAMGQGRRCAVSSGASSPTSRIPSASPEPGGRQVSIS